MIVSSEFDANGRSRVNNNISINNPRAPPSDLCVPPTKAPRRWEAGRTTTTTSIGTFERRAYTHIKIRVFEKRPTTTALAVVISIGIRLVFSSFFVFWISVWNKYVYVIDIAAIIRCTGLYYGVCVCVCGYFKIDSRIKMYKNDGRTDGRGGGRETFLYKILIWSFSTDALKYIIRGTTTTRFTGTKNKIKIVFFFSYIK